MRRGPGPYGPGLLLLSTGGPLYAQAEGVVVIVIGWEALALLALAVVAILLVAAIIDAIRLWWRGRRPRRRRIGRLKMEITGGVHECVYDVYEDGVLIGQYTWTLSAVSKGAGRQLAACPAVLHL